MAYIVGSPQDLSLGGDCQVTLQSWVNQRNPNRSQVVTQVRGSLVYRETQRSLLLDHSLILTEQDRGERIELVRTWYGWRAQSGSVKLLCIPVDVALEKVNHVSLFLVLWMLHVECVCCRRSSFSPTGCSIGLTQEMTKQARNDQDSLLSRIEFSQGIG